MVNDLLTLPLLKSMLLWIREQARLDLICATRWYASQESGSGREFLAEAEGSADGDLSSW
jgi:hypothetical protein